ncbi:MAG TPA: amidohydrolase family protein [Acidimicrobiia bacterium]|nr:amidohydrolase family protein [Acidimicrobiia bacterium]
MTSTLQDTDFEHRVVDADTHLTERHDLWTSRAPTNLVDQMPHVEQVDGEATWVVGGNVMGRAGAGGVIDRDNNKGRSFEALYEWEIDRIHEGAYDPVARLEMMDEAGVHAQVIFPNTVGLGGQSLSQAVDDPALRLLCVEMYNDSNAEMQDASNNRLLPMAVLPAWDVDACVREAQRCASLGMRGVNITSDPQDQDAPDLASRAWDPLWEVCADQHLPVHFHIGASLTTMTFFDNYPWPSHDDDTKLAIGGTLLFVGNSRVIVNIICSGMLERHPELQIVSVESGAGWVPFILEALDYEMSENAPVLRNETLSMSPSDYFKRQIYATMWFERTNLPTLVDAVGEDNILFETDFPHPTCLYPDPLTSAHENMRELSETARNKILGGNATRLYRL